MTIDREALPRHLRKPRLRRVEAAEYLEIAHGVTLKSATLARYVTTGGGPTYERVNRSALYKPSELDRWVDERIAVNQAQDMKRRHRQI